MSREGRDDAPTLVRPALSGPNNPLTPPAGPRCLRAVASFVRLQGSLCVMFGVCTEYLLASDASVVSVDHGFGAAAPGVAEDKADELPPPVWEPHRLGRSPTPSSTDVSDGERSE